MNKEQEILSEVRLTLNILMGLLEDIFVANNEPIKETIKKAKCSLKQIPKIETALKRLEEHDKIFKKYGIDDNWLEASLYVIKNHFPMDTETQLKKLKALEIIKKHFILPNDDLSGLYFERHSGYYEPYYTIEIKEGTKKCFTQEEYDLLKEVLL